MHKIREIYTPRSLAGCPTRNLYKGGRDMRRTIGSILSVAGIIGIIYYGYQYFQETEHFEALGAEVTVSTGDYLPIIISGVILLAGLIIGWKK